MLRFFEYFAHEMILGHITVAFFLETLKSNSQATAQNI